jgi:GGDEF domain-containing protein
VAAADAEPITEPEPPAPIGLRRPQAVPEPPAPDARASEALWIGAVEDEIRRAESSEAPLSLLLVELEDAERVIAAEHPRGASATFGRFAQSLRTALRRQDILACETDTRAWIIARETGRVGATSLADRVATAVRRAEPWRGAPMTVNVGVAVLREDGRDVDALMGAAEEAKFAAAARGVPVYGEREPPPSGGPGPGGGPHGPRLVP